MKYVPLYIKTDNSLQESMIKVEDLIEKALEYNITALTITDNTMYGVMDFYKLCTQNNIKPIVGLEISYKKNILILYCMNYHGYQNLIKLSTISSESEIDLNMLEQYSNDLICLVPYQSVSIYNDLRGLYKYIYKTYRNIDEKNNLTGDSVYMNETIYLNKEDSNYIKYLIAMKDSVTVDSVSVDKLNNYLMTYDEVKDLYNSNNEHIYELCDLEIPFHQYLMPIYDNPDNVDSYTFLIKKFRLLCIFQVHMREKTSHFCTQQGKRPRLGEKEGNKSMVLQRITSKFTCKSHK